MSAEDAQLYIESNGTYEFTPLYPMGNPLYAQRRAERKAALLREQLLQQTQPQQKKRYSQYSNGSSSRWEAGDNSTLCKFGLKCANADCNFAHPTPSNGDALILSSEQCSEGLSCTNENCDKSHPSLAALNSADSVMTDETYKPNYLDACHYGSYCTNSHCKYRHAMSTTLCRDGAECTRQDCIFTHPLSTPCKFDSKCINPSCIYSHPNGRATLPKTNKWVASKQDQHVSERSFAVDEAEVEKVPASDASSSTAVGV